MRILVGAQFLSAGSGGIARVARLTVRAAADAGYLIDALAAADKIEVNDLSVPVRCFSGNRTRFTLACQRAMVRCPLFVYDFPGTARAHLPLASLARPYALWVHGIEVWEGMRPDYHRTIAKAHTIFTNSHFTKARAEALHGQNFARANVCWLATMEDEPGLISSVRADGIPKVLIVGRLEDGRDKGHDAMIAGWPAVVAAVPDARLVIVGTGSRLAAIERSAACSSAAGNIDVLGFVSEQDLAVHFGTATVFAMPSRGEGFGLAYIEAMRYGLPVVASVHDAAPEINIDGVTGYNVDLGRPDELIERLIELLKDRDRGTRMGALGLQRWSEHFNYSKFRGRMLPLLAQFATAA